MRLTDRAGNNRETWERGRGHQQAEREARREAVIRLKLAGHTYAAIASELGIGRSQVADALEYARQTGQLAGRQPGLVEGGKRVKLTADQVEAVRDAAAREENRANIARRFGISRSQVGNYLTARSRADAPGPRRDRRRPVDAQSVRSAVAEGTPRRRVAEQFGITYEQVGRIVREEAQAGAGGPRYQPPPRADAAAIRIAAASGVSTRELARLHGLSPTHVARILSADAQSDAPGPTRAKRVAVDAVAVCGALAAGRSMAEVAVEFGISAHQVSMIARKKSQAARTAAFEAVVGRSPVKLDAESLRRLYEAHNFQWAAVAADLGFRSSAGLSTAMLRQLGDRPVEWARKQGLPFHAPSASRSTLSTGAFDSLIGVLPDAEVAAQAGCDEEKVRRRRYRLAHARRISAGEGGLEG